MEREVKYTRKWYICIPSSYLSQTPNFQFRIGAAECCTLMNYFDIPARIRNFVKSSNGDHVKEMFNFIWNHFSHPITIQQNKVSKASSEQSLYSSKFNEMRLPIYLQYDGKFLFFSSKASLTIKNRPLHHCDRYREDKTKRIAIDNI